MKIDRDELIGDIYAATTEAAGWRSVFDKFKQAFSGHTAVYERLHASPETHQLLATDLDPDFVRTYNGHYNARNVWATSPLNQAAPIVISERMIDAPALERTEFYADWLRPQRLKHAVTCPLVRQQNRSLNLGLVRDAGRGQYSLDEVRFLDGLLPHLKRAIEIASRIEESAVARHASLEMLAASGSCLFVAKSSGEIIFASAEGEALLQERRVLTTHGRRLTAVDRTEAATLERAMQKAVKTEAPAEGSLFLIDRRGQAERHSVAVTPFEGERIGLFGEPDLCVVLVAQRRQGFADGRALAAIFDLTAAEARLAAAICNGDSLSGYAGSSGLSVTTVKTHLRALFAKMGVNRQADLVRLVLADPVLARSVQ